MVVPVELTTVDISGRFCLNKSLTDISKMDEVLRLQGVGWFTRRAIAMATITLTIKHYKNGDGIEHIEIGQTATGIPGTKEDRTLDWQERKHDDNLFGSVIGKSRRVKVDDLDTPFLKAGWTSDTVEHSLIQTVAESDTSKSGTTWRANQAWGIEEVNGERRYMRHLDFTGPKGEKITTKFGYDYLGNLQ